MSWNFPAESLVPWEPEKAYCWASEIVEIRIVFKCSYSSCVSLLTGRIECERA